jgi:hypothetical protein
VGCGLLDLAHLKHGLNGRAERDLCAAYEDERPGLGVACDPAEFRRVLAACDLQNTLYRLAHIRAWGLAVETVNDWVEEVARLAKKV